jgi:hypothetical protein
MKTVTVYAVLVLLQFEETKCYKYNPVQVCDNE